MDEFLRACFSGPTLPASVLLIVVCLYWLMVIFGALDVDTLDVDLDFDADFDVSGGGDAGDVDLDVESSLGVGMVALRFLNIGKVPLMLWASAFAVPFWAVSLWWDQSSPRDNWETWDAAGALIRNAGVGVLAAKLITQPLRGKFDTVVPNQVKDLLGKTGRVSSTQVTDSAGQARVETDGAPLLLQVRTREEDAEIKDGRLTNGDRVVLADYDSEHDVFFVRRAE